MAEQTGLAQRQQVGQKAPVSWQPAWQQGLTHQPGVNHPLPKVLARDHVPGKSGFQMAQPLPDLTAFRHQEAARSVRVLLADAFEQASHLRDITHFRHQEADRTKRGSVLGEWENTRGLRKAWHTDFQPAKAWVWRLGGRYQEAVPSPPGISIFTRPKPPGPSHRDHHRATRPIRICCLLRRLVPHRISSLFVRANVPISSGRSWFPSGGCIS